jgi:hypothetical protein
MPAGSTPSVRAFSSGFALLLCAACATYVDEPPLGNSPGELTGGSGGDTGDAGSAGSAGAATGGGSGGAGSQAGSAGMSSAGTSSDAGGGGAAGAAGGGGMDGGGMGGGGGAGGASGKGGAGGAGGTGGKASGGSGGGGGTGGQGSVTCAMRPIPAKSSWKLSASHSPTNGGDPVTNAHDGNTATRWTTGKDQSGNEWLQIDFGVEVRLSEVTLMLGTSVDDHPRGYTVRVSNTSNNTAAPVLLTGAGMANTDTVLTLPAGTRGRYVLINQTGAVTALWWSVAEIQAECAD